MLYAHHFIAFIILNTFLISHSYDTKYNNYNLSQYEQEEDDQLYEYFEPEYDVSQYILYFKSYHSVWNNHDEWIWDSSHNDNTSINQTIACSKQNPSLCLNTQFITNEKKEIESLKTLKLYYKNEDIQDEIELDFWNDMDWSQVNIIHHNDPTNKIDRRQLLRGAISSKYGTEYYYDNLYDDLYDDNEDEEEEEDLTAFGFAAHQYSENEIEDISTMDEMNEFIFNQDDDISDIYNMDDYYKFYDRMNAEEWGVFKKVWKGIKKGAGRLVRHIGGKLGIYPRPPCSSASRCRVHLYFKNHFRSRANKKGHFCEGRWDRWRLHKYRVFRNRVSSIQVQGSPCCVAIAYNGNKMDGDQQAMFPRGRYPSMTMGLTSSMGVGNGMNGMGGGGLMGMMGGGMGMGGMTHMQGFQDRRMASMRIVHDCKLRQRLMMRGAGRMGMGMFGGMHGMGMMGGMAQMMQMMMMMKMMFPDHHNKHKTMCRYYSCIVKTQQSQLQQLMQMMMMSAMTNQAPITISDNTKAKRRRSLIDQDQVNQHVIGIKKCKMLYYTEICVTFDAVNNVIEMDYILQDRKELKQTNVNGTSDVLMTVKSLVNIFDNVIDPMIDIDWNEIYEDEENDYFGDEDIGYYQEEIEKEEEEEKEEEDFEDEDFEDEDLTDIDNWVDPDFDPDPFDVFIDYIDIGPKASKFANKYYDDLVLDELNDENDLQIDDEIITELDVDKDSNNDEINDIDTEHRIRLFIGPMMYGMHKNELIFPEDFGYEPQYSYLSKPPDNDIIDYFDTFILKWNDDNDWIQKEKDIKCNDVILSYISYSICIENNYNDLGLISFKKIIDENNDIVSNSFYEKTNFMINSEFDNKVLNIMNEKDWTEIYTINNGKSSKLCNYISMIKLCILSESESINLKNFKISIEYLSDEESKRIIRENNEIFNQWLLWSDFY